LGNESSTGVAEVNVNAILQTVASTLIGVAKGTPPFGMEGSGRLASNKDQDRTIVSFK
jgi:hypothetical protein